MYQPITAEIFTDQEVTTEGPGFSARNLRKLSDSLPDCSARIQDDSGVLDESEVIDSDNTLSHEDSRLLANRDETPCMDDSALDSSRNQLTCQDSLDISLTEAEALESIPCQSSPPNVQSSCYYPCGSCPDLRASPGQSWVDGSCHSAPSGETIRFPLGKSRFARKKIKESRKRIEKQPFIYTLMYTAKITHLPYLSLHSHGVPPECVSNTY